MRQVLGAGALGRPRGMEWGGRWEGGSGWGTHVNQWLIHVNVWQKPPQYCKVISLQLIKINEKKKKRSWVAASLMLVYKFSFGTDVLDQGSCQRSGSNRMFPGLRTYSKLLFLSEGNGNPLQYSCLEEPMDGGAW